MNLAKLPEILLKLSMASVEFAVTGNPLPLAAKFVEVGSEEITEAAKEFLSRKEAAERLIVALQEAEGEFNRLWEEDHPGTVNQIDIIPKLNTAKLQKAIAAMPTGFSERDVTTGAVVLVRQAGFLEEEAQQAAELWVDCLKGKLVQLEEYAYSILLEGQRELKEGQKEIKKDTSETLELMRGLDQKITGEKPSALPGPKPRFLVPFPRNERFVGREDDLVELHKALQGGKAVGVRPAALTGMGGIGKTQLAVEYAYRYKDVYPGGVYWINAAQDWRKEFADQAVEVGLSVGDTAKSERLRRLALAFVDFLNDHPRALLIFDNVDRPRQLTFAEAGFIPAQLHCRLLFTTRRREQNLPFQSFDVPVLAKEAAYQLLLGSPARSNLLSTDDIELAEAKLICQMLGYLPLALALAAAFLGKYQRITISDYRKRLEDEWFLAVDRTGIDPMDLPTRHEKAVEATLDMQYQSIESKYSRYVLQVTSIQGEATRIPLARLEMMAGLNILQKPGYPDPLDEAITELYELSLIEELNDSSIRLHPLVAKFAENRLENRTIFTTDCARNLANALGDVARLNNEVINRGIDSVIADLRVGVVLALAEEDGVVEAINSLLKPLDMEAHNLRRWNQKFQPSFFLQQLYFRSLNLENKVLCQKIEAFLEKEKLPWLRERRRTSHESPALQRTLEGHFDKVNSVTLSADGKVAVSASSDLTIRVWDVVSGQLLHTLVGHNDWVGDVALSADGRVAVSASHDRTIMVWDALNGHLLHTLKGHKAGVNLVALSADGKMVFSVSDDRTLKIWGVADGKLFRSIGGYAEGIKAAAISGDRRIAVIASADKTLKSVGLNQWEGVTHSRRK